MREPEPQHPLYQADSDVAADILSLFSADTAAAIREYTCTSLAQDLNITPHALEQIIAGKDVSKPYTLGIRFFSKRFYQFA